MIPLPVFMRLWTRLWKDPLFGVAPNIGLAYKSHYRVIHGLARINNAFWGSAVRVGASSA